MHRKTAMKVQGGRPLRKNNWKPDHGDYWARSQSEIRLDRLSPGRGYRHLVTIAQLRAVIGMLPDWSEVAIGLEAIALAPGRLPVEGAYHTGYGVIDICAWRRGLWDHHVPSDHIADHREVLDLLGVDYRRHGGGYEVRWSERQARAYQLIHILPHELGHHHDLITSRQRRTIGRGEPYAESYALRALETVWPSYSSMFDV